MVRYGSIPVCMTFLVCFLIGSAAWPAPVVITTNTDWPEGHHLVDSLTVQNGATLSIEGGSTVTASGSIIVTGNATILLRCKNTTSTVAGEWRGSGVTLECASLTVDAGSRISADEQGYIWVNNSNGNGPGGGLTSSGGSASGGGYGGHGADGYREPGGKRYGSSVTPLEPGSAGGDDTYSSSGNGGGAIRLVVSGTFTLNGLVSANGGSGSGNYAGGGSGGSIWVNANTLAGGGRFQADGGSASSCGGGGGRIAVHYANAGAFTGFQTTTARAGINAQNGTAGFFNTNTAGLHLRVYDTFNWEENSSLWFGAITFDGAQVEIDGGSAIHAAQDMDILNTSTVSLFGINRSAKVRQRWTGRGSALVCQGAFRLDATSILNADEQGYLPVEGERGNGPGGGEAGSSGGGYGGKGGDYSATRKGGLPYGSALFPVDLGSAGGDEPWGDNGNGGGAIRLMAAGNMDLDGTVTANGGSGNNQSAGSAGGSIWIAGRNLAGTGSLRANGGSEGTAGGGGGRIAVYGTDASGFDLGKLSAKGGFHATKPGDTGTTHVASAPVFYFQDTTPISIHGQEKIGAEALAIDLAGLTCDFGAQAATQTLSIATAEPTPFFTAIWGTTSVADGAYELRATFMRGAEVAGIATRQVFVNNGAAWHSGTISTTQTWVAGTVHIVEDWVLVQEGITLNIQPGAIVKFLRGTGIEVAGTLNAPATVVNPIIMTAIEDDTAGGDSNFDGGDSMPIPGAWNGLMALGIGFINLSPQTELRFARQIHQGAIAANQTWNGRLLHIIQDDVTVSSGAILTIEPGAIIKMDTFAGLEVSANGRLIAEGTLPQPIIFTSLHDDSFGGDTDENGGSAKPLPGDWHWIHNNGGQASFRHCMLYYGGGTASGNYDNTGSIHTDAAAVTVIDRCLVRDALFEGVCHWGGETTVTNTVIAGTDRSVNCNAGRLRLINCTLDDQRIGVWGHGGSYVIRNTIIANSLEAGIERNNSSIDIRFSDVWSSQGVNYRELADQTGQNGNISANPRFKNGRQGDWRLNYVSRCIDAADGPGAPPVDARGIPRYDDPRTSNTGIQATEGAYADMGAFEFAETAPSPLDLRVVSVSGPTSVTAGETVTVEWVLSNAGSEDILGPWHDALFLTMSPDRRPLALALSQPLVGAGSILGPGQTLRASAQIRIPGGRIGNYHWQICANIQGEIFEGANSENNYAASLTPVALDLPRLLLDGPAVPGALAQTGDHAWFALDTQGEDALVSFDLGGSGAIRLFAAHGYMPSPESYHACSHQFGQPDATVYIPEDRGGMLSYVLVDTGRLSNPASFSIRAQSIGFSVASVSPARGGTSGTVTLDIQGSSFTSGSLARLLLPGGGELAPVAQRMVSASRIMASFNLKGRNPGLADVVVEKPGGARSILQDSFTIVSGGAPEFWLTVTGAESMRAGREYPLEILWGNRGLVDCPMHDLRIPLPAGVEISLEPYGMPLDHTLGILTAQPDAPQPVMAPGFEDRRTVYVTPKQLGSFRLAIHAGSIADPALASQPVDWAGIGAAIRPSGMSSADWSAYWGQVQAQMGSNYGSFLGQLANDATILSQTFDPHIHLSEAGLPRPIEPHGGGVATLQALLSEIAKAKRAIGNGVPRMAPVRISQSGSGEGGDVHVLITTCGDYKRHNPNGEDLPNVIHDMRNWQNFFRNYVQSPSITTLEDRPGFGGFPGITDPFDPGPNPGEDYKGWDVLRDELKKLGEAADEGDVIVFTWSGHGLPEGIALPTSDNANGVVTIPWTDIMNAIGNTKASKIVIISDSCYSNDLSQNIADWWDQGKGSKDNPLPDYYDPNKLITITASDRESYDDMINGGLFTDSFINALEKALRENKPKWKDTFDSLDTLEWLWKYEETPREHGMDPDFTLFRSDLIGETKDEWIENLKPPKKWYERFHWVVGSADPNEKEAGGISSAGFVRGELPITFTVFFENQAGQGATAPVQDLRIDDTLSSQLDWSTFELAACRFGHATVDLPPGLQSFNGLFHAATDPNPVKLTVRFDPVAGLLSWYAASVDPLTQGIPEDPFAGFLPVNDLTGHGQGSVSFRIRPKASLPDGAQIRNQATIIFDPALGVNPPIVTNQTLNTIDARPPASAVRPLPETSPRQIFLSWGGNDSGGSGIAAYTIDVSKDGGPFTEWLAETPYASGCYLGEIDHTYGFRARARDRVGNTEAAHPSADTITTVRAIPSEMQISGINRAGYAFDRLNTGKRLFGDRATSFTAPMPAGFPNRFYIRTLQADRDSTATSFLSFNIDQNSIIYLARDSRYTTTPSWMTGWAKKAEVLKSTDTGSPTRVLYAKRFAKGKVTLGGNRSGSMPRGYSMYDVIIIPEATRAKHWLQYE